MNVAESQEVVGFHEAGHAVALLYFKHPVASVEIGEDTGRCVQPSEWRLTLNDGRSLELAKRETLMELILACCAGKSAMDRWYGWKAKTDENWRASDDYKHARSLALRLNDGDEQGAELLVAWLERRAELLVEKQWPRIHKLAFALLDREKLCGSEINKILNGHEEKCRIAPKP